MTPAEKEQRIDRYCAMLVAALERLAQVQPDGPAWAAAYHRRLCAMVWWKGRGRSQALAWARASYGQIRARRQTLLTLQGNGPRIGDYGNADDTAG